MVANVARFVTCNYYKILSNISNNNNPILTYTIAFIVP